MGAVQNELTKKLSAFEFTTQRLFVSEWHSQAVQERLSRDLNLVVQDILTPSVTRQLPPSWQGDYTAKRAGHWISERDAESIILIALEANSNKPVGLVILSVVSETEVRSEVRLGYLLAERSWGKGMATELISALIEQHRALHVNHSIVAGVDFANPASSRVLEKCGFQRQPESSPSAELLFRLDVN